MNSEAAATELSFINAVEQVYYQGTVLKWDVKPSGEQLESVIL